MIEFSIAALVLIVLVGSIFCWMYASSSGSPANFRTIVLANYLAVQPLSGIAHLSGFGSTRGYLDLLNFPTDYLVQATLAAALGLVGFALGAGKSMPVRPSPVTLPPLFASKREALIAATIILLLGPLAVFGVLQVNAIAGGLDSSRVIALSGGTARYSFLSHWFTWIVSLAAAWVIYRSPMRSPVWPLLALSVALTLIVSSLLWSGGRSILILMALPVTLLVLPYLRGVRGLAVLAGGAVLVLAVVAISTIRANSLTSSTGVSLGNWIDWEWGRFSIIGTSLEYVRANGYLLGQTFIAGITSVVAPILNMVGVTLDTSGLLSSTDISSRVLFGNFDAIYVVPGFTAELYVNFGLLGVLPGYFLLGRASWWVDKKLGQHTGAIQRLLFFYIGSLLAFRVVSADSASILFYLLYSGTPLLIAAGLAKLLQKRVRPNQRSSLSLRPLRQ